MKPRALDLFCGAGGATRGLQLAGFHVTGVDLKPQPRYCGDAFHQADAMEFPLEGYDFIWASPPCQAFTSMQNMWNARQHPDLLTPMRERLAAWGGLYVIENVPGAPMRHPLVILCGTMFGLQTSDGQAELRRHRVFEHSFPMSLVPPCQHQAGAVIGVYGGHGRDRRRTITILSKRGGNKKGKPAADFSIPRRREAMGIDWMKDAELSQAIPPAYSHFIGRQVIPHVEVPR